MSQNTYEAAYEALKAFEAGADKAMTALSIWSLPFRSIYSAVTHRRKASSPAAEAPQAVV